MGLFDSGISLGFVDNTKPLCHACGLHKDVNFPKFQLAGEGELEIMLIFDKPSESENAVGKPFRGEQYTFVGEVLEGYGISIEHDCWKTHAINCCYSTKLSDSKTKKVCEYCYPYPSSILHQKKPKLIICFGGSASSVVLRSRFSDTSAARWRGLPFWSPEHGCYCMVTYDPSKLSGSMDSDSYKEVIKRDIILALDNFHKKPPKKHKPIIETSINHSEIVSRLEHIYNEAILLAVDYETTGLKPDNAGHRIVTCSYSYITKKDKKSLKTFSFMIDYRKMFSSKKVEEIHYWMGKIAQKKAIKKIAHHLKFEENWTRKVIGVRSKGWIWCTMYAAHILDERPKHAGLKTQAFMYFQAEAYEEKLKKFLEPRIPGGNSFNQVDDAPIQDLLFYNGLDTYYTFLLYFKQKRQIVETPTLYPINKMFLDGAIAFADLEEIGFGVVPGYYEKTEKKIQKEIVGLEKEILETKECKRFFKKLKRHFQFNNDKDIFTMIYDVMRTEITKETKGGKGSTDAEILMGLSKKGSVWAKLFLQHTKLCTARDTFIGGISREISQHQKLHPFYHLHTTRTGRSSSSQVNWQNVPKRDKYVKELVRSGIISPIKNHRICEADYGSLEVRIAGCYTQDPVLLKYINNPKTDMHKDSAVGLFCLDKSKVTDDIRFYAKNGYVFANFYGASPKSCARSLWKVIPDLKLEDETPLEEHMLEQGFKNYKIFEDHIIEYSSAFWKKFKVFKKWQEKTIKFYHENGYIENKFGFRRRGFLGRNEIINTNIQGSAFQCLLWALIETTKIQRKRKWQSRVIGQIHDSMITSIHDDEVTEVTRTIKYLMEEKLREVYPWVITPMDAEFEITEPGGSWFTLKKFKDVHLPPNFVRF